MQDNPTLVLTGAQFLILVGIIAALLLLGWIVFFRVARQDPRGTRDLITGTGFVQNLTVIVVVAVTGVLAVIRVLSGELLATILSGIAGYAFGTSSRLASAVRRTEDNKDSASR